MSASFPVVLGDFGCDVTCPAIALGFKPPLVTRIAQTGLGTKLRQCNSPPQTLALSKLVLLAWPDTGITKIVDV